MPMSSRTKGALMVGGMVLGGTGLILLVTRMAKASPLPPPPPPPPGYGNLYGRVTSPDGRGVAGVTVQVLPWAAPDTPQIGMTNPSGNYLVANIPVGSADWVINDPRFAVVSGTVNVFEASNLLNITVSPVGGRTPEPGNIIGQLYNAVTGEPVPGATVFLMHDSASFPGFPDVTNIDGQAISDGNGDYVFDGVTNGLHYIQVIASGYRSYWIKLTMLAAGLIVDFPMNPTDGSGGSDPGGGE